MIQRQLLVTFHLEKKSKCCADRRFFKNWLDSVRLKFQHVSI